jgi:hypothetical protein
MLKEIHVDLLCCSVEFISNPHLELKCASALAALVQYTMFKLISSVCAAVFLTL